VQSRSPTNAKRYLSRIHRTTEFDRTQIEDRQIKPNQRNFREMGWPKDASMNNNNNFNESPQEFSRRSRSRSIARSLIADLKDNKIGTSRNPFINFLLEFRKITPTLRMNGAQLAKIGGEMWRDMTDKQKSQFQIVETRRRKRRRRRHRKHGAHARPETDS
jgi:hypothetical protein